MREVLAELMRLSEPATTTILLIELLPLDRLLPEDLPEDSLKPKLLPVDPLRRKDLPEELLKPKLLPFRVGLEVLNVVLDLRIVRRLEAVLRAGRELDLKVVLELIRLGDFAALGFVRGLMDLEGAETLVRTLPTLEARPALDPDELLVTCRVLRLPPPDLPLWLRPFFPKTGSVNSISKTTKLTKAILMLSRYFGIDIICLLILQVISVNSQKLTALLVATFFRFGILVKECQ